jgi:hypothetical protein
MTASAVEPIDTIIAAMDSALFEAGSILLVMGEILKPGKFADSVVFHKNHARAAIFCQ